VDQNAQCFAFVVFFGQSVYEVFGLFGFSEHQDDRFVDCPFEVVADFLVALAGPFAVGFFDRRAKLSALEPSLAVKYKGMWQVLSDTTKADRVQAGGNIDERGLERIPAYTGARRRGDKGPMVPA
jgi:hypothetical protein